MKTISTAVPSRSTPVSKFSLILTALALFAVAAPVAAQQSADSDKRPNFVVILGDDIGWSDTSVMGGEIQTPNLEKLAGKGKVFTHFYNTARCCPSRASLLTGLYPHQAGVGHMLWDTGYPGYTERLSSDTITIAEALRESGYKNYMVGKWHLTEREPDVNNQVGWPLQRGFDKFYGTMAGYGSFYDPATLTRGDKYITPENDPKYKPDNYYYTDAISDNAVMFIDEHEKEAADKPFFMYVAYTAAHWPLQAPEDAIAEYKGKYDEGYQAIRDARWKRLQEKGLVNDVTTSSPTIKDWDEVENKKSEARKMEAFAAMITQMDKGIGKIVDELKKTGELENTVVLFLQDNGGCAEDFFMNRHNPPKNVHVMAPDELQPRTIIPMQTRDGRVVKTGHDVLAGPDDSYIGYGPGWANVSDTPLTKVKHYTYEGGISTPLMVSWPAGMPAAEGQHIDSPGHLIDLMPTILELAKTQQPKQRDGVEVKPLAGKSLVPLLTGNGEFNRDDYLYWEHEENRAVRDDRWKLVADGGKPWELYDMKVDRGEQNNVAAEHPDVVKKMAAAWDKYADENRVRPLGAHRLRSHDPDPVGTADHYELDSGDVYPRVDGPSISNAGVSIKADIRHMAPNGTIVAQGAGENGYSLYMKDGHAHFAIRRAKELLEVKIGPIPGNGPAIIKAKLTKDGQASIQVNDKPAVEKNFYGPLLATPKESLTVGFDQDNPVGDYPSKFSFRGDIRKVELDILR